jgi:hypothetical protein
LNAKCFPQRTSRDVASSQYIESVCHSFGRCSKRSTGWFGKSFLLVRPALVFFSYTWTGIVAMRDVIAFTIACTVGDPSQLSGVTSMPAAV